MRLKGTAKQALAFVFMFGIGSVGVQDVDADGSTDFTSRRRQRPLVERGAGSP